jgi:[glutamine synthetase] adenylyltransferase / [glutamine synthetase]-adenylyl-L-tyrosine phosphorylase
VRGFAFLAILLGLPLESGFFLRTIRSLKLTPPDKLPAELEPRFARIAERLQGLPEPPNAAIRSSLARVTLVSDFVLSVLERDPQGLYARLGDDKTLTAESVLERVALDGLDEAPAMRRLRRVRHVELARIAWRDLAGFADLETQFAELSALADGMVAAALGWAASALEARHPAPRNGEGEPLPLLVIGMGKLGGRELNFSSDIDLVLLYPQCDGADGEEGTDESYFRRLAQQLIRLLDRVTEDGFVFRVDTRLRPFGASGPLVVSLPAFESYLVRHGRDWERYAYVKARLITGEDYRQELFDEILSPYVYRRYLDFGVFDALRQMKQLISQEVARKDLKDNVKLGPGGIREVEFVAQAFQLVRGGRNPRLRETSLLATLPLLGEDRQLGERAVTVLRDSYRYLRTLEHRIQAMDDRQTHDLPRDPEQRARLAYALDEPDFDALLTTLAAHRRGIEAEFEHVAWDARAGDGTDDDTRAIRDAWESRTIGEYVGALEFEGAAEAAGLLAEFRGGALYQRMDEAGRQRLGAVIARVVPLLAHRDAALVILRRLMPVLQAICRRSAYLALLNENPAALERLLTLVGQSALIARQIAEHPLLLDELLDARVLDTPPTRDELAAMLEQQLGRVDRQGEDVEATLEAIRQFQRAAVFRVAVADRLAQLPLMKVSDRLTDVAELVLELSLATAWGELTRKHGRPRHGEPPDLVDSGFAVIGYGKLGGLELGYGSDLDLVFLHDSSGSHQETDGSPPLDNPRFFARLAQRLIHFLTIQTSSGRLYEVDTRLRPSGGSGLMVASLENFRRYQRGEAWVWEHQALLRSRPLAGTKSVCAAFEDERREVLVRHVHRDKLKAEVLKMRQRMRDQLSEAKAGEFDLKQDAGGIADIEFLVDYWVLANSDQHPDLVTWPDNVRQLEALEAAGLVPAERCRRLRESYLALRQRVHELALDERGRVVGDDEFVALRAFVRSVWDEAFA